MSFGNTKSKKNPLEEMPKAMYNDFVKVLNIQSTSSNEKLMWYYIKTWLDNHGISNYTDGAGNIIATKGELSEGEYYPCVCSHMDTVHSFVDDFKLYFVIDDDGNRILFAKDGEAKTGIGGDDKCGIYSCLYFLTIFDKLKVVFFSQEESGLIGSNKIKLSVFDNCGYIIQLDRWGAHDFICKNSSHTFVSDEYLETIKEVLVKYDYAPEIGLITDSVNLFSRNVGISCVNVSCGYYEHHTNSEKIDVNEFYHSLKFTEEVINTLGNAKYAHSKPVYSGKSTYNYQSKYNRHYWQDDYDDTFNKPYARHIPALPKQPVTPPASTKKPITTNTDKLNLMCTWVNKESNWKIIDEVLVALNISWADFYTLLMISTEATDIEREYRTRTGMELFKKVI